MSVRNVLDPDKHKRLDALVDTGTTYLSLPHPWKDDLGSFGSERQVER